MVLLHLGLLSLAAQLRLVLLDNCNIITLVLLALYLQAHLDKY
jgi:hypothetical protein